MKKARFPAILLSIILSFSTIGNSLAVYATETETVEEIVQDETANTENVDAAAEKEEGSSSATAELQEEIASDSSESVSEDSEIQMEPASKEKVSSGEPSEIVTIQEEMASEGETSGDISDEAGNAKTTQPMISEEPIHEEDNAPALNTQVEETTTNPDYLVAIEEIAEETEYDTTIDVPDDAFSDFVDRVFLGSQENASNGMLKAPKRTAGSRLTGNDRRVYDYVAAKIQEIANGNLASTVIDIPISSITEDGKTRWTRDELGVSSITAINESGSYALTAEAKAAMSEKYSFTLASINQALLADFPYDLYWYDKTVGCSKTGSVSQSASEYNSSLDDFTYAYVVDGGYIRLSYSVSADYAKGDYLVDTTIPAAVQSAANKAQQIVNNHYSETDYEKMDSYRSEICSLVDYNDAAADKTTNTAYGDPWQLIWVFDEDASTKVVCEGYSKAFQYLCNLSDFSNSNVKSIIVTGNLSSGTGAGGHMWNVVTMKDGRHYLVDVTNCDEGSVGYEKKLFVAYNSNGSASEGYTFADAGNVSYTYDAVMFTTYDEEALTLSTTAYSEEETELPTITGIEIDPINQTLFPGMSVQMSARIMYSDGSESTDVTWESSDPSIATISEDGLLTTHAYTYDGINITARSSSDYSVSEYWNIYIENPSDYIAYGPVGNGIRFYLDNNYALHIEGKGEDELIISDGNRPWEYYKNDIKKIYFCGLSSIGNSVFAGHNAVEDIYLADASVQSIGREAFSGCTSLKSALLPFTLKTIGEDAFRGCNNLLIAGIPATVESIGNHAFEGCESLRVVRIEQSDDVESMAEEVQINSQAFANCPALEAVFLADSVRFISDNPFSGSLDNLIVYFDGTKEEFSSIWPDCSCPIAYLGGTEPVRFSGGCYYENGSQLIIQSYGGLEIDENDPQKVVGTTKMTTKWNPSEDIEEIFITPGFYNISSNAVRPRNLRHIYIPSTVTEIEQSAFNGIENTGLTLPETITTLGDSCVAYCRELKTIILKSSVAPAVTDMPFVNCAENLVVVIPDDSTGYDQYPWTEYTIKTQSEYNSEIKVSGFNVSLMEGIYLNAYIEIGDPFGSGFAATVYNETTGSQLSYDATDLQYDKYEDPRYRIMYEIPAKNMTDRLRFDIYTEGVLKDSQTISVAEYCEGILAQSDQYNRYTTEVVAALLNYGAASQEYFGYNMSDLANRSFSEEQKEPGDTQSYLDDLANYNDSFADILPEGVEYLGSSLILKSQIGLRHYFRITTASDISAYINPEEFTHYDHTGYECEYSQNGSLFQVTMYLKPTLLGDDISVHIVIDSQDVQLTYNPRTYMRKALNKEDDKIILLIKALYSYGNAAYSLDLSNAPL